MTNDRQKLPPRRVVVLTPDQGQLVGIIGFLEAFDAANRFRAARGRPVPYAIEVVGVSERTASVTGLVLATAPSSSVDRAHTLVVGGGLALARSLDPAFVAEVGRLAATAERVVGVCAGAFALAAAGWLDGRRCTTHWMALDALRSACPSAWVEDDALHVEDGPVFTSAGATAGIDLALHLVRADCGPRMALAVARSLVVFAQRPGGQSQFSATVRLQPGPRARLGTLVAQVVRAPADDHGVDAMARRVGMSPRHFARVFKEELGETPAAFVTRVRVEAAQALLVEGEAGLAEVAGAVGFGSLDAFRRSFARVSGVSPSAWRERFAG